MEANWLCPNCKSKNTFEKGLIPVQEIIDYYADSGVDVRYLLKGTAELHRYACPDCGLQFFRPIILGDDHYYSCMQKGDWYYLDEKPEYDYVARLIGKEDRVLDIGSGRGAFSKKLHCKFYQGLEFSESAVALAEKDGVNVIAETVEKHAQHQAESYDVVVSFQVLEHVAEAWEFISGALGCLKKGGKLAIAVPNCDSFLEWRMNYLNMPPHHQLLWNEKSLRKLAEVHHLKVLDIYKERVAEVHKESFYSTLLLSLMDKISPSHAQVRGGNFAQPQVAAGVTPHRDLAHRMADALKVCFRLVRLHRFFEGHTITAIYEKN